MDKNCFFVDFHGYHFVITRETLQGLDSSKNRMQKLLAPSDLPITKRPVTPFTVSASKRLGSASE